jgi:hypothetical protein
MPRKYARLAKKDATGRGVNRGRGTLVATQAEGHKTQRNRQTCRLEAGAPSRSRGVTQSCVTAGIVLLLVLVLFILSLSLSLSSGMGGEKEKDKE